ncbi:hypothetical protein GDO86_015950, partial [Hymenochirus boettgeri]
GEEFISEKYDILLFIEEKAKVPLYEEKLKELQKQYSAFRKTRADGSCFYRGLCFAYLEFLLDKQQEILRFKHLVVESKNEILMAGFLEQLYKQHYETNCRACRERERSLPSLLRVFNQPCCSDSAVQYVRLLASAYIKNRAEFYQPFITEGMDIQDFCAQNVEPMATECDHIQIIALSQALGIPLQVEYVDKTNCVINHHLFPEGCRPSIFMLFEDHHYNILYSAEEQEKRTNSTVEFFMDRND